MQTRLHFENPFFPFFKIHTSPLIQDIDAAEKVIQHSLKHLAETLTSAQLAFVTHADVRSLPCFQDKTVIAIKAPSGAKLNVPEPQANAQVRVRGEEEK